MTIFPNRSNDYFAKRAPLLIELDRKVKPFFDEYSKGKYSHNEYVSLIKVFTKEYKNKLTPIWEKCSGYVSKRK